MLFGSRTAANTEERWRVAIQQPKIPVRAGVIEFLVELARGGEGALHSLDQFECAETFGSRQLAKVHAEIILGGREIGFALECWFARGNPLLGELRALCTVGCQLGQIKA